MEKFVFCAVNGVLLISALASSEYNLPLAITLERMQPEQHQLFKLYQWYMKKY